MDNSSVIWLETQYLNQYIIPYLTKHKKNSAKLINCRCFICGDSDSNKNKMRGYFIQEQTGWRYYCHNCEAAHHFEYILKRFFSGYELFQKEKWLETHEPKPKEIVLTHSSETVLQTLAKKKDLKAKSKSDIIFLPCSKLPEDHYARQYLRQRMIDEFWYSQLYFISNFAKLFKTTDYEVKEDPRVVIPIKTIEHKTIGYIGRTLLAETKYRYSVHMLQKTNTGFFNLNKVNNQQPIKVLEGAFDSMCVSNALSIGSCQLTRYDPQLFDHKDHVLIFDHQPRNKEVMTQLRKAIWQKRPVCIWDNKFSTKKDINLMVLSGISKHNIEEYISNNTYTGLAAQLKFQNYVMC